ncbi:MAG: hypothetical protein KBA75_06060 [Alphaproteobacteria bacterium]|nr:hypothetical protein [Alphaproteobacteria bacterium]
MAMNNAVQLRVAVGDARQGCAEAKAGIKPRSHAMGDMVIMRAGHRRHGLIQLRQRRIADIAD